MLCKSTKVHVKDPMKFKFGALLPEEKVKQKEVIRLERETIQLQIQVKL
jgi:hypothetical protein